MTLAELLGPQRVLPLVEVDDAEHAIELARVLVGHGMPVMEIALRTPGAMSAIEAVRSAVAGAVVGAGHRPVERPVGSRWWPPVPRSR